MAGLHEEQFLFLTGVCRGALSMCKHFCLEVCSGVAVEVVVVVVVGAVG